MQILTTDKRAPNPKQRHPPPPGKTNANANEQEEQESLQPNCRQSRRLPDTRDGLRVGFYLGGRVEREKVNAPLKIETSPPSVRVGKVGRGFVKDEKDGPGMVRTARALSRRRDQARSK